MVAGQYTTPLKVWLKEHNLSIATGYRMIYRGDIVAAKIGRQWRIDEKATMERIEQQQQRQTAAVTK